MKSNKRQTGIAKFFSAAPGTKNNVPKSQGDNSQNTESQIEHSHPSGSQRRLTGLKRSAWELNREKSTKGVIDLSIGNVGQGSGGSEPHRKKQFRKLLGDGEDSQAAALREVHERFSWLQSKHIRDTDGRRPGHSEYDRRTVHVPPDVFKKLSDSQKQYWSVKSKYRDTVIFFKVGKFYELYEDDAQIGVDVLNWRQTITGVGHCRQVGCPESGIDEAVARLVAAGYKVARMEQMETAEQAKAARGPKATIRRQLTRVHTPATATGDLSTEAVHLMALHEQPSSSQASASQESRVSFGFAFFNAAAGRYYVGVAEDDAGRSTLGALLTQVAPRELLVRRMSLSAATQRALATPSVPMEITNVTGTEFPDPDALASGDNHQDLFNGLTVPHEIQAIGTGALAALAALCLYLKRGKADNELVTSAQKVVSYETYAGALCLDGPTLTNLELLENATGGTEGSLLSHLDTCASPGGRRLLRMWLCRPLRDVGAIEQRLDAVYELVLRPALAASLRAAQRAMLDIDRALGRARNAAAAPQLGLPTWALQAAQRRRLVALDIAVTAVAKAMAALRELQRGGDASGPPKSVLLVAAAASAPDEHSPAVKALMKIDEALVRSEAPVKVSKGKAKAKSEGAGLSLHPAALESFRMESRSAASESEEDSLLQEIELTSLLIQNFLAHSAVWEGMEEALSSVDVLTAFAAFTETSSGQTCRPTVLPAASRTGQRALLDLRGLWHPSAVPGGGAGSCIVANDLVLGGEPDSARTLLLTGPNMGGKSTILRAACWAVILAQMGCPVPAASATLTVADRIFTRLGAQDRIMAGQSTFLVECTEAAAILQHATADSLVICDELGRGTSTFDGYAIAHAVLENLSCSVNCRLLFATHYHPLTMEFQGKPQVKLGHMAALVTGDSESDGHITFLYQLLPGACPKSYGLQVARLAGIPNQVILKGKKAGMQLEEKLQGAFGKNLRSQLLEQETSILGHIAMASSNGIHEQLLEAWQNLTKG